MGLPMSKYARFIWRNEQSDHSIQLVDVIDMAVSYPPLPLLGCDTYEKLLSKLFEPNKAQWVADDEWFVAVPDGVQSGAVFTGMAGEESDPLKYENPDGTYADGTTIPKPVV